MTWRVLLKHGIEEPLVLILLFHSTSAVLRTLHLWFYATLLRFIAFNCTFISFGLTVNRRKTD